MSAIRIEGLRYTYRTEFLKRRVEALRGIDLDIAEGESFGFLGPNGAGKTTTIKCLLGLVRPSAGRVLIFGRDARTTEARESLGYLPEQPYFYDYLSVRETMELYGTLAGLRGSKIRSRIGDALERLGMSGRADARMRSLSKGLTQRVAMAQAIVAQPRLLILDEPFSGLDPLGRREFRELLVELKREGTALFMSSHVLSDVEQLCDRASITLRGELKTIVDLRAGVGRATSFDLVVRAPSGVSAELRALAAEVREAAPMTTLVLPTKEAAEGALHRALHEKLDVRSFEEHAPSLEELFVTLAEEDVAATGGRR